MPLAYLMSSSRSSEGTPGRPTAGRRAFSIVELLIVLVMIGILSVAMMGVLQRQTRFGRITNNLVNIRSQMRQATAIIPAELRGVSSVGGDIYSINARGAEFRSVMGASTICAIPLPAGTDIIVPPRVVSRNNAVTTWLNRSEVGDSLFVYDEGAAVGDADDTWRRFAIVSITSVTGVNGCALTSGLVLAADTSQQSFLIRLSAPLGKNVQVGAPLRFFRPVQYRVYQEANGQWYLGFRDCLSTRLVPCSELQQLSGPYRPFSNTPSASGLSLAYFDSLGIETAVLRDVARVELSVSAQTGSQNDPLASGEHLDSLAMTVALRNRY